MADGQHQVLPAGTPVGAPAQGPGPEAAVQVERQPELGVAGLVERLAGHHTLGAAPRAELVWLATHGELVHYDVGYVVASPTKPVTGMYTMLSGRMAIYRVQGDTRHKIAEWHAGDVSGLLPYSRLTAPPGDVVIEEPSEFVFLGRDLFPALVRECHEVTSALVHVMLDRARFFTSASLHDEKLKSLGKLAAGLAHELNNPAAAIRRFAKVLPGAIAAAEAAAGALEVAALTEPEASAVRQAGAASLDAPAQDVRSPLEEARRQEAIADWLEAHGIDPEPAEAVALSPLTLEDLERLSSLVRPSVLATALRFVAADSSVRGLAYEIEQGASRISDLVTAVRGFARVDAATVPEPLALGPGLAQTLAVLKGKARGKGIRITVDVQDGLPPVRGIAAELNQVWSNLIDNALDAAPRSGHVEVTARREKGCVAVRVVDDGPGIPAEIRDRIFDPFFTTKDVGQGTGLGLDIVRRLVDRHGGDLEVQSRPGRTEFMVTLPATGDQV